MALVKVVSVSVLVVCDPTISLESLFLLLKSSALSLLLLDDSTLSDIIALASTKKLASSLRIASPSTHYRIAILLFKLCRTVHPDGPFTLAREGSSDLFPRTAIILYIKQRCLLF
jgi:hypothetical protein